MFQHRNYWTDLYKITYEAGIYAKGCRVDGTDTERHGEKESVHDTRVYPKVSGLSHNEVYVYKK
jgi:hypothetical protein